MVAQKMNDLEIQIQDPREIREVSKRVLEKAKQQKNDELYAGLDHNHYSIVRGKNEQKRDLESLVDLNLDYPVEVFREDGGNSWVHSPESRCYEKVQKIPIEQTKSHKKLMKQWAEEITNELNNYLQKTDTPEIEPVYDSGDIYNAETGKQIAGLSAEIHGDQALFRMCTYDGENHGEEFHNLIETDLNEAEIEIEDLRNNYEPLPGFYDHLMSENASEVQINAELEQRRGSSQARPAEYCISDFQPS